MASAMSSLANSGSLVHSTASMTVGELAPVKKRNDSVDADAGQEQTAHMTKFVLDFQIDTVHLSLTQLSKDSNADQKLFHFTLEKMSAKAVVRTYDLSGTFNIGGVNCEHLLLQTPSGDPVHILATNSHLGAAEAAVENAKELLSVVYTDVNKNSPEFQTVHQSVLKRLDIKLSSVQINCHQDAILDLVAKITKFINEVSSKAKNLMAAGPEEKHHLSSGEDVPDPESQNTTISFRQSTTRQPSPWRTNRKISMKTTSNLSRWAFRAKKKAASLQREIVEVKIVASLESVTCDFMTSCVHFAELQVKDLQATYEQTKTKKTITSKLVNFQIHDALNRDPENIKTLYEKIAESMDQKVFDAQVVLYDHTLEAKAGNPDLVDVEVDVKMGRVKLVFLMKFITDFLTFLEPFSGAKEIVAEQASNALEEAAKSMIDAYANSTRAKLNILMDAPIIIIPVHSKSMSTLIADLGTLKICNRFKIEGKNIFDELHIRLENLQLERAKIDENVRCNDILASTVIVHPITFELDVRRNMNGAMKEDDPAELLVKGTLYQIILETSKEDYNVLLAILQNNFSEKGEFELLGPKIKKTAAGGTPSTTKDRTSLMLPLKNKHSSGSRTSLSSERSIKSLRSAMKVPERDPDARVVEFSFQFRGFKATLHTGVTDMTANHETRDPANALAEFTIKVLSVKGHVLVSSAISADAYLQNCVLEDCRHHDDLNPDPNRIIRLMEAKSTSTSEKKDKKAKMIDIHYERDELGSQKIDVNIYSFVLVGSVPYLLEIANFFIPDEQMNYEWKKESRTSKTGTEVSAAEENEEASKLQVFLKIDEPDIFLVENIQDINSDALMLNMELQLKYWCTSNSMSMMASLANIRCHTCRFNPKDREKTMAQILQPCTLSFTISKTDGHGNRVNVNMSDLCLNISPHSIAIMQKSVEAFIASMATSDPAESKEEKNHEEDWSTLWQIREFQDDEFWFLRPDDSVDALDTLTSFGSTQSLAADEQAMININNLVVKMESGVGNNTIPLILLESSLSCDIRNWSTSRMNALGSINLEVAYYNSAIALWEPVIEPVCQINPKDGSVIKKKWGLNITVQSNSANDFGSAFVSPSYDEADGILCTENMLPLMMIALQSRDILEVTVTKSFLSVLNTLTQSFSDVTDSARKSLPTAPFIIQNHTGKPMTLLLDTKGFKYYEKHEKPGQKSQVELAHGKSVNLFLFKDRSSFNQSFDYVSPLQEQTEQAEASLRLRVGGESGIFEIPVSKADKRFFPFRFRGDEMGDNHGMVSEVSVDNGCKYITLRSIIQVKNHFDRVVNVFTYDGVAKYDKLTSLKPDDSFNVPLGNVYASPYEFYFMVEGQGQNMGLECFPYR